MWIGCQFVRKKTGSVFTDSIFEGVKLLTLSCKKWYRSPHDLVHICVHFTAFWFIVRKTSVSKLVISSILLAFKTWKVCGLLWWMRDAKNLSKKKSNAVRSNRSPQRNIRPAGNWCFKISIVAQAVGAFAPSCWNQFLRPNLVTCGKKYVPLTSYSYDGPITFVCKYRINKQ